MQSFILKSQRCGWSNEWVVSLPLQWCPTNLIRMCGAQNILLSFPQLGCQIFFSTRAGQLKSVTLAWRQSSPGGVARSRWSSPVDPSCGWWVSVPLTWSPAWQQRGPNAAEAALSCFCLWQLSWFWGVEAQCKRSCCNIFLSSRRPLKSSGCRTATHIHFSRMCMAMEWCCLSWCLELCLIPTSTTEIRFHFSSVLFFYFCTTFTFKGMYNLVLIFFNSPEPRVATSVLRFRFGFFFKPSACELINRTHVEYYD